MKRKAINTKDTPVNPSQLNQADNNTTATNITKSEWQWNKEGGLIYGVTGDSPSELIAAFDMDDTLIQTKSGAKFAKSSLDWKFWHDKVETEIKEFNKKGYRIVIFSNQRGISKGHTKEIDIKNKIEAISSSLGFKVTALIASADDQYAKPNAGMWKYFTSVLNEGKIVNLKDSFFVGDAAGRVNGKKKDFSDSDLKWAINIGIPFKTPEQFFLKQDLNQDLLKMIGFNPKSISKVGPLFQGESVEANNTIKPDKPEVIVLVGSVGSGKSTFAQTYLKDYTRINRDTLKTKEKCHSQTEISMGLKQYIVIDNTNPAQLDRKPYIDLAKKHGYSIRAFYLQVTKDIAMHNDTQREVNPHRQHLSKKVGSIPIHSFFKNSEAPSKSEGFNEVKIVNFVAGPFSNPQDEDTYFSFAKGKK